MEIFQHIFPIKNPVAEFAILMLIVLIFPVLFKKLKIPSIVGLIIAGMIVGPHSLNILDRDDSIIMLGSIGLLYIMFLAGLELDLKQIKTNKRYSVLFGIATFTIPLVLGYLLSHFVLGYSEIASLIIALMFSTHTLVAYPIALRLGLTQTRSTTTVVGGTIITDTAVLMAFGVIMNYYHGSLTFWFWVKFIVLLALVSIFILFIIPKIALWFFKNIEEENYSQFIFVIAMFVMSSMLMEVAGIEAIVGAFLAGLAFSKLIPHNSALMQRIHLVGSGLFIPLFLINVGMIVDIKVLATDYFSLIVAGTLTIMALLSKYLAAHSTQLLFKFSKNEADFIFGLSASHAAATIAVIMIAYKAGILDENVLNGTILLILVTCLFASFVTERAGRKLAIEEQEKKDVTINEPMRILVPCSNPNSIDKLLDLAIACRGENEDEQPIFPLSVIIEDDTTEKRILQSTKAIQTYVKLVYPGKKSITPTTRLDTNVTNGIIRAMKEMMINLTILGWTGKSKASEFFFGKKTDNVIEATNQTIMVAKLNQLINLTNKIYVFVGENAQYEVGFKRWLEILNNISKYSSAQIYFICLQSTKLSIIQQCKTSGILGNAVFELVSSIDEFRSFADKFTENDIIIFVKARSKSISFSLDFIRIIDEITEEMPKSNYIMLYPETNPIIEIEEIPHVDVLDSSFIEENISLIQKLKTKFFKTKTN